MAARKAEEYIVKGNVPDISSVEYTGEDNIKEDEIDATNIDDMREFYKRLKEKEAKK